MRPAPPGPAGRGGLRRILQSAGLWFLGAASLFACDPLHEWVPVEALAWREPKVSLLADAIAYALAQAGPVEGPIALVSLQDQYARRSEAMEESDSEPAALDPGLRALRERSLRDGLQQELARAGLPALSPEAVEAALPASDLVWSPEHLARFSAATGARHLVRAAVTNYTVSRILERDALPVNQDLHRVRFSWSATLRLAILDRQGAIQWIDEVSPSETLEEDFYERRDGTLEVVRRVAMPWGKDPETWHDISRHGGEDEVGLIPVLRKQP